MDRMVEVVERVPQQRIARFERLDQAFLLAHRSRQLLDLAGDAGAVYRPVAVPQRSQGADGSPQPSHGLDQRIVVAQQAGTRPQQVALKRGVVEKQGAQRFQRPLVNRGVGRRAAHQQIGEQDQQPGNRRQHSAEGSHGPALSAPLANGRP
jgi:hypothetical protein